MKKLFALIFACLSLSVYANEVQVEAAYIPTTASMNWDNMKDLNYLTSKNVLTIDLSVKFTPTNFFFIGGSIGTFMIPRIDEVQFNPFYTSYTFETGFYIMKDIEIGYKHNCTHSVDALGYLSDPLLALDTSYDKIYFKYTKQF